MAQIPTVIGLQVCEKVIVEEGTKNVSLVSCHTILKVRRVPSEPRQFTVFAELIDGAGEVTLEVIVSRLENDQVMYRQARGLTVGNRPSRRYGSSSTSPNARFPRWAPTKSSSCAEQEPLALRKLRIVLRSPNT